MGSAGIESTSYTPMKPIYYTLDGLVKATVTFKGRSGGDSAIAAGTVVGMVTADKTYQVYDDGATDGTETAVGILTQDVPALSAGETYVAEIAIGGYFLKSELVGWDAAAKTDLGAREIVKDSSTTIVKI